MPGTWDGAVDEATAREALTRVLASDGFRVSPRLAAFLAFVIERTLAGEAATLKGYTIATGALGRPSDFDPQVDPIVRVEAGRLRRALDAYYAGPGRYDPVVIAIPRGRYVPSFAPSAAPPPAETPVPPPAVVSVPAAPSVALPVAPPVRRRLPGASAALAATAAVIGFALGVYATALLAPRGASWALAAPALVRTD